MTDYPDLVWHPFPGNTPEENSYCLITTKWSWPFVCKFSGGRFRPMITSLAEVEPDHVTGYYLMPYYTVHL